MEISSSATRRVEAGTGFLVSSPRRATAAWRSRLRWLRDVLGHLPYIVCRVRDHTEEPHGPGTTVSATLIDIAALCTSTPMLDLTVCMSLILLSTGEPKPKPVLPAGFGSEEWKGVAFPR